MKRAAGYIATSFFVGMAAAGVYLATCAHPAPAATAPHPGSANEVGCGHHLWQHVYHPHRLVVLEACAVVTGTVAERPIHEADGDAHVELTVDAPYRWMLDGGNIDGQQGRLVLEVVCHWRPRQRDAVGACAGYSDTLTLPDSGQHVVVRGPLVRDLVHGRWNEIHPVAQILADTTTPEKPGTNQPSERAGK